MKNNIKKFKIILIGTNGFLGSSFKKLLGGYDFICINDVLKLSHEILNNYDIILNCAGASSVSNSFIDPLRDFDSNVSLVSNILERIRLSGNKEIRFINLSSASVYGNPRKLPIAENDQLSPISPYGFGKMMAEQLCQIYNSFYGIKTLSLRIFSAYGVGQKKMLLWDLHQKVLNAKGVISLFGTGLESRDFIHIDDIFQQIMLSISNADFKGEAINIGNGKEVKIIEIAEIFKKLHPVIFEYSFSGEIRIGDPINWCADISKMNEWGYEQKKSIYDGVDEYIKWAIVN